MKPHRIPAVAALGALVLSTPAVAAPMRLAPASGWVVDRSDETCRVIRRFGASNPVTLVFEQVSPRGLMTMLVSGKTLPRPSTFTRVTADFAPVDLAHFEARQVGRTATGDVLVIFRGVGFHPSGKVVGMARGTMPAISSWTRDAALRHKLEADEAQRAARATEVAIDLGKGAMVLPTGPMTGPMALLRGCLDQQLRAWKLDPAVEADLSDFARPMARPMSWLSGYKATGIGGDKMAMATARLLVDANGRVSDCRLRSPADPAGFEEKACATIVRTATFIPAKDGAGKPVASYYVAAIPR